jgi:hypothetical protein
MTKVIKKIDKTLKLYLEIERELRDYFKFVKKYKWKQEFRFINSGIQITNGLTYHEYTEYKIFMSDLYNRINSLLKRLRIRLNIPTIKKWFDD